MHKDVVDTLVLSRLIYSHIEDMDAGLIRKKQLPSKLYKSHSLKAWGYRLGELKGTYGEEEDAWACYNPEMLAYNKQDVVVTVKLYEKLASYDYAPKAIKLEHEVAWLMSKQEKNGFPFDLEKAKELEATLRARAGVLIAKLIQIVPRVPDKISYRKETTSALAIKQGFPFRSIKTLIRIVDNRLNGCCGRIMAILPQTLTVMMWKTRRQMMLICHNVD